MPLTPLLTASAMRAAEAATFEHVPARVLMETAGRALADAAERHALSPRSTPTAAVLCGGGNNGGDGFVAARVLAARGWDVAVLALRDAAEGDAGANLALLQHCADGGNADGGNADGGNADGGNADGGNADGGNADGGSADGGSADGVTWIGAEALDPAAPRTVHADVIVDALLGIGATGALRAPYDRAAAWANAHPAPTVSADLPTGLDATTGIAADGAVRAAATVAFGALKTGLVLGDGPEHAGTVTVAEIGVPDSEIASRAAARRADGAWVRAALPRRAPDAHKYSAGTALCVVGSRAFSGAAILATGAALRAGAGAVRAAVPAGIAPTLDAWHAEVMAAALPETDSGGLARDALGPIRDTVRRSDAVLVGCGLGRDAETQALVRSLAASTEIPLVLDADGLHAFAGDAGVLAERSAPTVLTPHLGELRALLGDAGFEPTDRIETVRDLAARWQAVVLLKGMPSVLAAPDGRARVGPPGHPALATAGTGDVLAGLTVGLIAQGVDAFDAATCALHLGWAAAHAWSATRAPSTLGATDLLDLIPAAWAGLG